MDLTLTQSLYWLTESSWLSEPSSQPSFVGDYCISNKALYMHCFVSRHHHLSYWLLLSAVFCWKWRHLVTQLVAESGCTARPDQYSQSLFTSSLSLDSGSRKSFPLMSCAQRLCYFQHDALLGFQNEASNLIHWDRPSFSHSTESLLFLAEKGSWSALCSRISLWGQKHLWGQTADLPLRLCGEVKW